MGYSNFLLRGVGIKVYFEYNGFEMFVWYFVCSVEGFLYVFVVYEGLWLVYEFVVIGFRVF